MHFRQIYQTISHIQVLSSKTNSAHSETTQTRTARLDRYWPAKLETSCSLLTLAHQQIPQNAKYFSPWLVMAFKPNAHSYNRVWSFTPSSCKIDLYLPVNSPTFWVLSKNNRTALQIAREIKLLLYHSGCAPFHIADIPIKICEKIY